MLCNAVENVHIIIIIIIIIIVVVVVVVINIWLYSEGMHRRKT